MVKFVSNCGELGASMFRRIEKYEVATVAAMDAWGYLVKARAEGLSQGNLSYDELSGYDPGLYSRKRTGNKSFDAIINKQTGLFASSWHVAEAFPILGMAEVYVFNDAPYSGFMGGTSLMRKRPILQRAVRECPSPALLVRNAIKMAVSGGMADSTPGFGSLLPYVGAIAYTYSSAVLAL